MLTRMSEKVSGFSARTTISLLCPVQSTLARVFIIAIVILGVGSMFTVLPSARAAQIAIRQTASAQGPGRNCADDGSGPVCTPSDDTILSLTLTFAPTTVGTAVGLYSNGTGQCHDNLAQSWTPHFVGNIFNFVVWISPPTGGQTAGITSVTCKGISQTQIHFFEISGVKTLPQFLGVGGNGSLLGQFSCGTIAPNALGLFLLEDQEGWLFVNVDPGLPPMSNVTTNLAPAVTTSVVNNFNSPFYGGVGFPAFGHNRWSLMSFYGIGGAQGFSSTFTVTNATQGMTFPPGSGGGASAGCASIQFQANSSQFQISQIMSGFAGPLPPINVPLGGGNLSTSATAKLGQQLSLQYLSVDAQSGQVTPIPSTITFQSQQPANMGNISAIFSDPTRLFPDNVLLHFTAPAPDQFFAVHSGTAVLDIKPNDPSSSAPEVFLTVNVPSCSLGQSCGVSLGSTHNEVDDEIVRFADFRGIPPQLIKSQVGVESTFNQFAYRYEPLTVDFKSIGLNATQLNDRVLAPWRIATSNDCSNTSLAQGTSLILSSLDANKRNDYTIALNQQNQNPLCRVTNISQVQSLRRIQPTDTLLSMENIFYTNDPHTNWADADIFQRFADFQVDHPPFTGQTVIAASYGLHQVLYTTATQIEGFVDANGIGLPPSSLFDKFTSLDLGAEYLAQQGKSDNVDGTTSFQDKPNFYFQFGPALRGYNAPKIDFSVADIKSQCLSADLQPPPPRPAIDPFAKYRYACKVLRRISAFDDVR